MTFACIGDETYVKYVPDFLTEVEASQLFQSCKDSLPWKLDKFGKYWVPRLTAFEADVGIIYKYSGLTHTGQGVTNGIASLVNSINVSYNTGFNSVLYNYYRDEKDSIGLHCDNEKELGFNPIVATLSLGGVRRFDLVNNKTRETISYDLQPGSLFIMGDQCQLRWKHKIDKYTGSDPRISLTLRRIINVNEKRN